MARHLNLVVFPATGRTLARRLTEHQAPQELIDLVAALPADAVVESLHDLLRAVRLPVEHRNDF